MRPANGFRTPTPAVHRMGSSREQPELPIGRVVRVHSLAFRERAATSTIPSRTRTTAAELSCPSYRAAGVPCLTLLMGTIPLPSGLRAVKYRVHSLPDAPRALLAGSDLNGANATVVEGQKDDGRLGVRVALPGQLEESVRVKAANLEAITAPGFKDGPKPTGLARPPCLPPLYPGACAPRAALRRPRLHSAPGSNWLRRC